MSASNPGFFRRLWRALWTPAAAASLGFLLIVGFIVGVVFWGGFNWALEVTNTEKFCISCHEMRDNVYAEYEGTVHQNNGSGVRATCPDCHVPKEWGPKMVRKIKASQELYGHFITGVIDTPEKFEEHRLYLAGRVWTAMKETDSRECRNCHNFDFMDFTQQQTRAADNHQTRARPASIATRASRMNCPKAGWTAMAKSKRRWRPTIFCPRPPRPNPRAPAARSPAI